MPDSNPNEKRFFFDQDANLENLSGKTAAIIGYGNQGRSQALNMRDSGIEVIIGSQRDASFERAREDGFNPRPITEAVASAQIIFILVPDEIMPALYSDKIAPGLNACDMIVFASGYNIFFRFLEPAKEVDVVLLGPRMFGQGVRDRYLDGRGFPSLIAVHHDSSGNAWPILLALAKAIGSTKMGALESSFEEETILDLFSEHAVAGVRLWATRTAFEVLKEYGIGDSAILLELYASGESEAVSKAAADIGLWDQLCLHSRTSQYGQLTRGQSAASDAMRRHYRNIIDRIRDGSFAREWNLEQQASFPTLNRLMDMALKHKSVKAEKELFTVLKKNQKQSILMNSQKAKI
jgi:ketol-acid reductoisomerase